MTPRIFLHVGSPKTGTTFLQEVLWSQRELALERGLLLPGRRFRDHYLATVEVTEASRAHPEQERFSGAWDRLASEAGRWPHTTLISHELFAPARRERATEAIEALGDAEVHLVLTVRDLARQIPAEWQEHVKHRSTIPYGDFIRAVRQRDSAARWFWSVQDTKDIIARWADTLPPDRVHVVTVPPSGTGPEVLWERFCAVIGMDPAGFNLSRSRANASLKSESAELMRRVNVALGDRIPFPGRDFPSLKDVFAQQILAAEPGSRIDLDEATLAWAERESSALVSWLTSSGVDVVGDVDELLPGPRRDDGQVGPDEVSAEELLPVAVDALAEVLVRFSRNRRRLGMLEAERREHRTLKQGAKQRLIQLSNRRPWAMRLRHLYRSARNRFR